MPKYWKYFQESWRELEERFHRGECEPEQENDVVCYIYHALLTRLERDGVKPSKIKTEYTLKEVGRIDMNIDNKLLIEFMKIGRRSHIGLDNKKKEIEIKKKIENLAGKFHKAIEKEGPLGRWPVIALWNWKTIQNKRIPKKGIPKDKDIELKLNQLRKELLKNDVRFIFGPKTPHR